MKRSIWLTALTLACLAGLSRPDAVRADGTNHFRIGWNPVGAMAFRVHLPPSYTPGTPLPLVVALHGCLMTGFGVNSMEATTGLSELADQEGFIVMYPSQDILRNTTRCWNFEPEKHRTRGQGEASLIMRTVEMAMDEFAVDRDRVYMVGLSSGGAMASVMAVTYPDVFAAVGIGAGCEYACEIERVRADNDDYTPIDSAEVALAEMGPRAKRMPVVILQGLADETVPWRAAERLVEHWAHINDIAVDGVADGDMDPSSYTTQMVSLPGEYPYFINRYRDRESGRYLIEKYMAVGLGHAWPGGGEGLFTDKKGPPATWLMWSFLRRFGMQELQ